MNEHDVGLAPDDLQRIDNALADGGTPAQSRRALLRNAAVGAVGLGAIGPFAGSALAAPSQRPAAWPTLPTVLNTAVTVEELAVTYLVGVQKKLDFPPLLTAVLKAAATSEYDHRVALGRLGGKPLTSRFWVPDAAFKDAVTVFKIIEQLETLFVNAYLIGMSAATARGARPYVVRYMGEILGVEAEHRVLARVAQVELGVATGVPNNKGFETYVFHRLSQIVDQITKLGIGIGKQGARPGAFYTYPGDPRPLGYGSRIYANFPA